MADIRLVKPQPNTAQTVSCAADSRFVFEFPSDTALFAKDGNDLVLTFEDGSSLRLQNFYTTYSKEEMPTFEMEGTEISGEDFFAALGNPDLMPAAGPSASAQGNSSFNVYDSAALMDGIDRLDGLDIGFTWGQQPQDDLYASIGRGDDDEGTVDHGVTVTPDEPDSGNPGIPVVPNPDAPGNDRPGTIVAGRDVLEVSEANLANGTAPNQDSLAASGSMTITAPDGVASITIGGTVVYKNGQLTDSHVRTDEGYLEVTGYDPSTGKLDYTFHLEQATDEHIKGQDSDNAIAHEMTVTVTDSDGDTGSGVIRVEISDDAPMFVDIKDPSDPLTWEGGAGGSYQKEEGSLVLKTGADDLREGTLKVTDSQDPSLSATFENGSATITYPDGSTLEATYDAKSGRIDYIYTPAADTNDSTHTFIFEAMDTDNDLASAEITVNVELADADDLAVKPQSISVDESGLANGTLPDTDSISRDIELPEGYTLNTDGWMLNDDGSKTLLVDENKGQLVFKDGKLTYTLLDNYTHDDADQSNEGLAGKNQPVIDLTLTHTATGVEVSTTVTVDVHDDAPEINVMLDSDYTGQESVPSHVDIKGNFTLNYGADGEADSKALVVTIGNGNPIDIIFEDNSSCATVQTILGTLTVTKEENNNYSYCFSTSEGDDPVNSGDYAITFTGKDTDEDTASKTVHVTVRNAVNGTVESFDDNTLASVKPIQQVTLSEDTGSLSYLVGANGDAVDKIIVFQNEQEIGQLSILEGKLYFTQTHLYSHDKNTNEANINQTISVINARGETVELDIAITIHDSTPEAHQDVLRYNPEGENGGNLLSNDELGADCPTEIISISNGTTTQTINPNGETEIKGQYGTLTVSADGTYKYTLNEGQNLPDTHTIREVFTYTIQDSDGDISEAPAGLTILIGSGTLYVKESSSIVNEEGEIVPGTGKIESEKHSVNAKITDIQALNDSIIYTHNLPEENKFIFESYKEDTSKLGYDHVYETNYGNLYINTSNGDYFFELDDEFANPLQEGMQIVADFQLTTIDDNGMQEQHIISVVIEGSKDGGLLEEQGNGGHSEGIIWVDAKAEGTNTTDFEYNENQPNINDDQLGNDTVSRDVSYLPFTLKDPDLYESLSFTTVYNGAHHNINNSADLQEGQPVQDYVNFIESNTPENFSIALNVAWNKFTSQFTDEQLQNMSFHKTEYGIFVITEDAVDLSETTLVQGKQYWIAFLADSDSDALRNMAEGTSTAADKCGILLQYSFQVKDSTDLAVQTPIYTQSGNNFAIKGYSDQNTILVHLYGSNDTPTISLIDNKLHITDTDINEGNDTSSHTIEVIYNNKTYTGTLKNGEIKLTSDAGVFAEHIYVDCNKNGDTGYTLSGVKDGGLSYKKIINGDFIVKIIDNYSNTATYHFSQDQNGDLHFITANITNQGTNDSDSLYGGTSNDSLSGLDGNDSLWGFAGDDTLYGGKGNDRLYGDEGNDTLNGGEGIDILVGGTGDDTLDGGTENDVLIGDGQGDLQTLIEGTVSAETFREFLDYKNTSDLEAFINKYETEVDGNDQLYGKDGDDLLFGMGGNDYLNGGAGSDSLFGGSGNDIVVYDPNDFMVSGGTGIDFMVSADANLTLEDLEKGDGTPANGPIVEGIDVLLKGQDALSLTNMDQLAREYGITVKDDHTIELGENWKEGESANTYTYTGGDGQMLTMEVAGDIQVSLSEDMNVTIAQQQINNG